MSTKKPSTVERTSRTIIEHKLLVALSDESKCALILGRPDLDLIITGLSKVTAARAHELRRDLETLRRETFEVEQRPRMPNPCVRPTD